jgi:DnaJ family protein A protein 2
LQCHPDKGGDQEAFKKLNGAYEILSDPQKRELYNNRGKNGLSDSGQVPEDVFSAMFGNMFQNFGGFGNVFGMFRNAIRKTQPSIYDLHVSLEDLCTRKITKLKVTRDRPCQCSQESNCAECAGKGMKVSVHQLAPGMFQQVQQPCQNCQGQGKIFQSCQNCQNGIVQDLKILEINLIPDMDNGYKYVLHNEGNQSRGMEPGDFIAVIHRKEHPVFQANGKNLIYKKEITLKEALCGCSFDIEHPSGEIISVCNREIITPETRQILPKGITTDGSMEIKYKIIFPKSLTPHQTEIINQNL